MNAREAARRPPRAVTTGWCTLHVGIDQLDFDRLLVWADKMRLSRNILARSIIGQWLDAQEKQDAAKDTL